ncbi:hypothetical protein PQH03_28370 [Ralstonia insidiosa]|jgi:hypothetical protein|uniref:Uncharacterized protein n=1 Tax=Ralstonia insidiosa TaxID=190721 RepID=A0A192A825_9RALS|nr:MULTISPECIES: hypothetical protein [Ralstonia]KMW44136.1 hypothetical protein AC240_26720 [Ralstonia sp. MD27]ANJ76534.1 hypothetical protein A9Y76_28530 [Ralstonia insidiosa]MBA9869601.1 hypothetical protein [Ralstonia insidiosa]MBA9884363.1 hypothetical protein [Ralstonia pickettii]MBA9894149.1 hypothetical protein [Ralstonia pickettii]
MEKHHTGTVHTKLIEAFFQPQAWINDYATDIDEGYGIDVTQKVLSLQLTQIHELQDCRDSTDALVDAVKLGHNGPYTVAVVSSVLEFFGVRSLGEIDQDQLDAARTAAMWSALQDRIPSALLKRKVLSDWGSMVGLTLHDGYRFLVASHAKAKRVIAVVDGLFNRDAYKALISEMQGAGVAVDNVHVYCEIGSYTGPGIEIVKFDDFPETLGRYRKPKGGEDYVILSSQTPPNSYVAHSPEDVGGEPAATPPQTSNIEEAVRFVCLSDASAVQEELVKRYPGSVFLIDIAPHAAVEGEPADVVQGVPDLDGLNDERAMWARQALDAFQRATNCEQESVVGDLLCDLMHHCDRTGVDFLSEMGRAVRHYEDETSAHVAVEPSGVLESLLTDALELRDMKVEINNDYSQEDLLRWGDRLAVADKAVEMLKELPLYPHLELRARKLATASTQQS